MEIFNVVSGVEWIMILSAILAIVRIIFKTKGYAKGIMVIDELQTGLEIAKPYMLKARLQDSDTGKEMGKAAVHLAANVSNLVSKDAAHIVNSLTGNKAVSLKGVKLTLTKDGGLSVDPTGLATKYIGEAGKFISKYF